MRKITTSILSAAAVFVLFAVVGTDVQAQDARPASPRGSSETQIDGKWVAIDYGRPILRGRRSVFGSGDSYGKTVLSGADVWRLGANQSTQLSTETPLHFGDHMVPAGDYTLFAELSATGWTLIVSNHTAKDNYGDAGDGLWGAYGYSADMDVARIPMTIAKMESSVDQFTIGFTDVTAAGGTLNIWWDDTAAKASFKTGDM
ncbi:MAG: DUF2911 domain-containing protein [Rhodothermales bacterium]|nr:DUF2911 domain-containing protein [Rhodothermales bacterium]